MATTVSAVVRRGSSVLLVRQKNHQRDGEAWFLPGGVVEPGEHLHDAVRREVLEETGLTVGMPERLAYASHVVVRLGPDEVTSGHSYVFEVADPAGDPDVADPDDDVTEAAFQELRVAQELLQAVPFERMRVPALAFLDGRALPGTVWLWEYGPDNPDRLVAAIPALGSTPVA